MLSARFLRLDLLWKFHGGYGYVHSTLCVEWRCTVRVPYSLVAVVALILLLNLAFTSMNAELVLSINWNHCVSSSGTLIAVSKSIHIGELPWDGSIFNVLIQSTQFLVYFRLGGLFFHFTRFVIEESIFSVIYFCITKSSSGILLCPFNEDI